MEELIQQNCINCLVKSNASWYKIKIYKELCFMLNDTRKSKNSKNDY